VAISARPVSTRGAYRDRHEREAGCGGRGSVGAEGGCRARQLVSVHVAKGVRQNRVVLAPVAGVKLPVASLIRPDRSCHRAGSDGGKRNSSPGKARHKPSNHCAGNAGVFRLYLYARVRISLHHAHETAGAACTRHSLHPPLIEGDAGRPRTPCVAGTQTCVGFPGGIRG
jgi:hypothetical protein